MGWDTDDPRVRAKLAAGGVLLPGRAALERLLAQKQPDGTAAGRRLAQSHEPLLNKLEAAWFERLKRTLPPEAAATLRGQAVRFRIANGAWYKPDMTATVAGRLTAWECKGPKGMKGQHRGTLALKCAAATWPEVAWVFVWRERGEWFTQAVLP